jgi:hypothetical protein
VAPGLAALLGYERKYFPSDLIAGLSVAAQLERKGVQFVAAGRRTEWEKWAERREMNIEDWKVRVFPTLRAAVKELREKNEVRK